MLGVIGKESDSGTFRWCILTSKRNSFKSLYRFRFIFNLCLKYHFKVALPLLTESILNYF